MGKRIYIMPPEGRTAGLWEQPAPFVLPHSVELAFVRSMECPWCHSNLLMDSPVPKSPKTVYCPVCGWKPRAIEEKTGAWYDDPERAEWQHGLCDTYAKAMMDTYPHLRLGVLLDPETNVEQHYFAHDDQNAYDSIGVHPLPYTGYGENEGQFTQALDQDPAWYGIGGPYPYGENGSKEDYDRALALIQRHHQISKVAHGYGDDFRTLLGMMKNAYQNEEFGELLQLATRMQITADEMIPQARADNAFMTDSVPGHNDLMNWIYPQDPHAHNDLIDKHVKLQYGQSTLPGNIKQYAGFIEQAIIDGDLKGFKKEMLQKYIQGALKQFHETGKWQGKATMDDPEKSPAVIDGLFQYEISKSDPVYQKLQNAVHKADDCALYIQWLQQLLDEGDNHYQDYLTARGPWQQQYDQAQQWQFPTSKTAAHVDVQISYGPIDSEKYFGGQYQVVATKDGQDVGVLIIHDVGDYLYVPHTEIAPEYRDTDVFMQLAAGLMGWMRETGNVKPIAMQTIYPGIKNLVDRWNSRFENLPEGVYSELYDIKDVAPGRTDMAWFYSKEAFDMPPLENPVSYEWTPWTDQELAQWDAQDDITRMQWKRKSRNLTRGARRRGYAGSVTGRDLWLLNNRYRGNCAYCGQPGADSWDHVQPLSAGGEHTPSNILPAHLECNHELGRWDDRNRDYRSPSPETIQQKPQWTTQPAEAKVAEFLDETEPEFGDPWSPIPKYFYGERVIFRGGQGAGMIVNDEPEVFEGGWWYRVQADDGKTYQAPEEALLRPGESDHPSGDTLESMGIPPEAEEYYRNASQMPLGGHRIDSPGTRVQAWGLTSWKRIEPSEELRNIAHGYMANQGWGDYDPPQTFPDVDPERAKRIAEEYEKMEHNPNDPNVREAYDALIRETMAQYDHLVKNGYQLEFEPYGENPYPSPWDAINDIRENKHLYVYPTYRGFGQGDDDGLGGFDHPLVGHAGFEWPEGQRSTPVTYNDVFRGVHDIFGHAKEGVGFRSDGEENAWRQHSAMYSEPARRALTSETRGQNSWVNYGKYGEQNQTADQANTVYAEQKAGIMPDWTVYEGAHDE